MGRCSSLRADADSLVQLLLPNKRGKQTKILQQEYLNIVISRAAESIIPYSSKDVQKNALPTKSTFVSLSLVAPHCIRI